MKNKILLQWNKFLLFLFILFGSFSALQVNAQSNKEEVDMLQSLFGAEKKVLLAEFLKLDSTNPFWAIYDEYETERKQLGLNRMKILTEYADNFSTLDDAKTDEIVKQTVKQMKSSDALIAKYYKKVRKASGAKVAAQFFHFENYILSAIRYTIYENIPAIGDLE